MEYAIKTLKSQISICEKVLDKFIDLITDKEISKETRAKLKKQMEIVSDEKYQCEKAVKILCSEKTEA